MIVPNRRSACAPAATIFFVAAALTSCAAPAPKELAAQLAPLRVMVKLVRPAEDAASIGAEATRVAGVPVTYAAATSLAWHALYLHCTGGGQCEEAIARLRAAGSIYQAVEIDGRKKPAS